MKNFEKELEFIKQSGKEFKELSKKCEDSSDKWGEFLEISYKYGFKQFFAAIVFLLSLGLGLELKIVATLSPLLVISLALFFYYTVQYHKTSKIREIHRKEVDDRLEDMEQNVKDLREFVDGNK